MIVEFKNVKLHLTRTRTRTKTQNIKSADFEVSPAKGKSRLRGDDADRPSVDNTGQVTFLSSPASSPSSILIAVSKIKLDEKES